MKEPSQTPERKVLHFLFCQVLSENDGKIVEQSGLKSGLRLKVCFIFSGGRGGGGRERKNYADSRRDYVFCKYGPLRNAIRYTSKGTLLVK